MQWNIPNILTSIRIVFIPVFAVIYYLPYHWTNFACAAIFAVAAITDWLDGYLARKMGLSTRFGAFFDPVADKLLVVFTLILLVGTYQAAWFSIPAAIIVGREIAISALREWMAEIGERAQVAVSYIGKIKTTAQMISLLLLLYRDPIGFIPTEIIGLFLLYCAAALTLWSMIIYLKAAWPILMRSDAN